MTLLATPQQAAYTFAHSHVKEARRNRYGMVGRLYLSKSGYLLLSVPNSFVRGAFDALNEPGIELPFDEDGKLSAHITVMRPSEIERLGGPDKIDERGRDFSYALGRTKKITPYGWPGMSTAWVMQVHSLELKKLRRTYGLSAVPNDGKYPFHITIAVRRTNVLYENEIGKTAALGIPDRSDYGDLSKLKPGDLVDWVIQRHLAQKSGPHYDVRFGTPETGLYSWATRKELPEPGKRIAMFQQPVHAHGYKEFQGPLTGYGQGVVRTHRKGQILITGARAGVIEFTMATGRHPERFALVKPKAWGGKDWLLVNTTPTEPVPYDKIHFTKVPVERMTEVLGKIQPGSSVQAKIDGASSLVKLMKDKIEVISYRASKETGHPIIHTERVFGGRPEIKIPKELEGTVLKGELYGLRQPDQTGDTSVPGVADGSRIGGETPPRRTISPQELGGILNAALGTSLTKQRAGRIKLRNMLHGVAQFGKLPVRKDVSYEKQREMLKVVLPYLPKDVFHLAEETTTPEEALKLWQQIGRGEHPLTAEGVVIHPPYGKPLKSKYTEDTDVHITRILPGGGKYTDRGAGAFGYSLMPGGQEVGRVGTGFTDELRQEMLQDPEAFVGRVARIRAQEQFPSGAYRAPALLALHEDYPSALTEKPAAEGKPDPEVSLNLGNSLPQIVLDLPKPKDEDSDKKDKKPSPVLRIESKTITTVKVGGRGLVMTPPAKKAGVEADLAAAAKKTDTDPTEAQIEAGNYKKGKINLHGLEISIENPRGSTRSGTSSGGKTWSIKMQAHYGYIKQTEGKDGDHVDVFIGPDPESELVCIVNQNNPGTGKFDEHKCVLGCTSDDEARELYLANYEKNWKGLGDTTLVTMPQFKWWLQHGDTKHEIKDNFFAKQQKAASASFSDPEKVAKALSAPGDEAFWNSPPNKENRRCPDCGRLFKEVEPLPDVEICEACARYGPPKKAAETIKHVPTVGVDFDGTITKLVMPYEKDVSKLKPRPNARKWLKRFQDMGARVIIFTVRNDDQGIKDWCHEHDIPIDYINENPDQPPDTSGKVFADVYWDDRGVDASGALDKSGPEVEKRLGKAAQVEPIYRRALRTQLYTPTYSPKQSLLSNVFANLHEARERGFRIISQADAMDRLRASMDPGFGHRQLRAILGGRYQPRVTDPIDRFVFQRTM